MDWWSDRSLHPLREHFRSAREQVRIATGFFSVSGYNLVRRDLERTRLRVMVGYDERAGHELTKSLLQEILDDLGHWHENRRDAVMHMVSKLRDSSLRVLDARTRRGDHGKVYLIDNGAVIIGSTNFTRKGLLHNVEANTAQSDPARVRRWSELFEGFWSLPDTVDISQQLLERLLAWLALRSPFEVYMKSVELLLKEAPAHKPRENYRLPADFQMVLVNRALGQLERYRGAMIVASTGLGKTVVATHIAYELKRRGVIQNVLVFAPKPTKGEWERRLRSAGVAAEVMTLNQLDRRGAREIEAALAVLDDQYLLILDESHYFKNRDTGSGLRHSFKQLLGAHGSKCRVLLLTATPYATDLENINHQLLLLPRTAPERGGMLSLHEDHRAWQVAEVAELNRLEAATVLNTPTVARIFGQLDEVSGAEYILYPDGKRMYLPGVRLLRIPVPVIAEAEMVRLLNSRILEHKPMFIRVRGRGRKVRDSIEDKAAVAWASSPWALRDTLEGVVGDHFKAQFLAPRELREAEVGPVLDRVRGIEFDNDPKFLWLQRLVERHLAEGQKTLIFSERRATVAYLETGLSKVLGRKAARRLASTVTRAPKAEEGYDDRPQNEIEDLIRGFAPLSNRYDHEDAPPEDKYDVFVTTDALAAGINLQDASVQISYDLAWGADLIVQRAGRIMRLWPEPRQVTFYSFVPDSPEAQQAGPVSGRLSRRTDILSGRLAAAQTLTRLEMIPGEEQLVARLSTLVEGKDWVEDLGRLDPALFEHPKLAEVSPVLMDLTVYRRHRNLLGDLGEDFGSVWVRSERREPLLYTLLRYGEEVVPLLFQPRQGLVQAVSPDTVFDLIRCEPDTPVADANPEMLEEYRSQCVQRWCMQRGIPDPERVAHVCSLLLVPAEGELFAS